MLIYFSQQRLVAQFWLEHHVDIVGVSGSSPLEPIFYFWSFTLSATSPLLDNIKVILVEPQGPMNIGSTCRAMKNFGLSDLTVVRPGCKIGLEAKKMAMHAHDILDSIKVVDTIPKATKGSVLVLGTANRRNEYLEPSYTVEEGMERIREVLKHGPVSIVFGREEWGMTNDDLKHCMGSMRIITDPENTSLNLSQAVLLISYELFKNFGTPPEEEPMEESHKTRYLFPPTTEEINRLYKHMQSVLTKCEFMPKVNPDGLFQVIRAFFHRSKPNRREINILMGIFSNVNGFMKKYVKDEPSKSEHTKKEPK